MKRTPHQCTPTSQQIQQQLINQRINAKLFQKQGSNKSIPTPKNAQSTTKHQPTKSSPTNQPKAAKTYN